MVNREFVDSDRVNFLVWRYLLESNFRETAAKLQKEWHIQEPHRKFAFAGHVKGQALVSLVQKGLLYHALQREHARGQNVDIEGVFGPFHAQPPRKTEEPLEDTEMNDVDAHSPVAGEALPNGSRQRLSNGHGQENGAYPSPSLEQVPTPIVHTDGPEQGTQVEKVEELTTETTFLQLTPDDGPDGMVVSPSHSLAGGEHPPVLLHCEWNPQDPSILAAAGTGSLARVWTLPSQGPAAAAGTAAAPASSAVHQHDGPDHVNAIARPSYTLAEEGAPRTSTVTALAWNHEGSVVAVATEQRNKAHVALWGRHGNLLHKFDDAEPPIIKLRWNPTNAALLTIAPDGPATIVTIYTSDDQASLAYRLEKHDLNESPLDATWTSETDFLLCGGDIFLHLRCTSTEVELVRAFETREDDVLGQVLFDWRSKLAATTNDKGSLDLWNELGQRHSISAHTGTITALQWQPLTSPPPDHERLIASSGDDCAITIWNANTQESRWNFTMDSPVVAIAFTPDGAFLAGASAHQVLIWKVDDPAVPRASWRRTPHPGWLSPKMNGDGEEEEDVHCLCWDSSGQKLAYGASSRLAVIRFR